MSEITVAGHKFTVPAPYAEGHVLNAGEAAALNQTFAENLRNNMASRIKKGEAEAKTAGTTFDPSGLQAEFDKYASEYAFGVRRSGGGGARTTDPVEREAVKLAVEAISNALKAKGHKIGTKDGDYKIADVREHAKVLAADPSKPYLELARQRMEQMKSVATESLDEIMSGSTPVSTPVSGSGAAAA